MATAGDSDATGFAGVGAVIDVSAKEGVGTAAGFNAGRDVAGAASAAGARCVAGVDKEVVSAARLPSSGSAGLAASGSKVGRMMFCSTANIVSGIWAHIADMVPTKPSTH